MREKGVRHTHLLRTCSNLGLFQEFRHIIRGAENGAVVPTAILTK